MDHQIFRRGMKVWIRNPYVRVDATGRVTEDSAVYREGWIPSALSSAPLYTPAEITAVGPTEVTVTTLLHPPLTCTVGFSQAWPLNPVSGIDDCADFTYLHEPAVSYNLIRRYLEDRTITRAGPVIVSINPFRHVVDSSGVSVVDPIYMARYRARLSDLALEALPPSKRAQFALPPHIYGVAERALTTLTSDLTHQCLVLVGPSGSGKSEACKAVLQYWMCVDALREEGIQAEMLTAVAALSNNSTRDVAKGSSPATTTKFASRGKKEVVSLQPAKATPTSGYGVSHTRLPALLAYPDVASARRDAAARAGTLGSACNPFISQRLWGRKTTTTRASSASPGDAASYMFLAGLRSPSASAATDDTMFFVESEASVRLGSKLTALQRAILAATVVLENFGCARTGLNDNSTCHAKTIEVHCNRDGNSIIGAKISLGLFDRSRAAKHSAASSAATPSSPADSGTFHVFRRLVAGAGKQLRSELSILDRGAYAMLAGDRSTESEVVADAAEFENLCAALVELGIDQEKQAALWRILSGLLTLGNVRISEVPGTRAASTDAASTAPGPGAATIANSRDAGLAARLLGVSEALFVDSLVRRSRGTVEGAGGTSSSVTWQWKRAVDVRAVLTSLINSTYASVVTWLVRTMNAAFERLGSSGTATSDARPLSLSIVDVGGLDAAAEVEETAWRNPAGLSTLARNYFAEKVQELYLACVFKADQLVYETEGLDVPRVSFVDNMEVVLLLDDPRTGLLNQLEEANAFPRSTDATFATKIGQLHKKTASFQKRAVDGAADSSIDLLFGIRHSGGFVAYNAANFLAGNKERVDPDIADALPKTSLPLLADILASGGQTTLSSVAVSSMTDAAGLLQPVALTQPTFVRCFTPNASRRPKYIDTAHIHQQLLSSATIPAIQLRHSGFPYKNAFADFYERFIILVQRGGSLVYPPPADVPIRDLCKQLLAHLVQHSVFSGIDIAAAAKFGHTRIFLKKPVVDALEALREVRIVAMDRFASRIQAMWRGYSQRTKLLSLWEGFRRMQAAWKTLRARALWLHTRNAAVTIQTNMRLWQARCKYRRMHEAIVRVQSWYRRCILRRRWVGIRAGLSALHCLSRGYIIRCHVMRMLAAATKIQAAVRRFLAQMYVYRVKYAAAVKFQSAWRAYRFRIDNEDVLQFLGWQRAERAKHRAVAKVQAAFRAKRVREAFAHVKSACVTIQRFVHTKQQRTRFLAQRRSVKVIQAAVRGFLARQNVRHLKTLQVIADELWRLSVVREREVAEVIRTRQDEALNAMKPRGGMAVAEVIRTRQEDGLNATKSSIATNRAVAARTPPTARELLTSPTRTHAGGVMPFSHGSVASSALPVSPSNTAVTSSPGTSSVTAANMFPVTMLLDVDPQTDSSLLYPTSWAKMVSFVERELKTSGTRTAQISLGGAHTIVLSEAGHVYSFGFSERGQCGHGRLTSEPSARLVNALLTERHQAAAQAEFAPSIPRPLTLQTRSMTAAIRIKAVTCGEAHSLALSEHGVVYAWGSGRKGQVGLNTRDNVPVPCPLTFATPPDSNGTEVKVAEVVAGAHHSLALLTSGTVYAWGDALCVGNCESTEDALEPVIVKALARTRVRHVASGPDFVAVVSTTGDVYTWGNNKDGKLGLGEDVTLVSPEKPRSPRSPRSPASSTSPKHATFDEPQPVTGIFSNRYVPTLVEGLARFEKHSRIVQIACGSNHCLALSSTGKIYAWGSNSHGQLGLGCVGDVPQLVLEAYDAPIPQAPLHTDKSRSHGYAPRPWVSSPVLLRSLDLRHALGVAAGRRASYAITDMNEVLAWGYTSAIHKNDAVTRMFEKDKGIVRPSPEEYAPQNGFLLAPLPTDVPIHELPGRAMRKLTTAHSAGLSVAMISFVQHQASEAQIREHVLAKTLSSLRVANDVSSSSNGDIPNGSAAVASTLDFLSGVFEAHLHNNNNSAAATLHATNGGGGVPSSAAGLALSPTAKPAPLAVTSKWLSLPPKEVAAALSFDASSRRMQIVNALVNTRTNGSPSLPAASPAVAVARDALLTPSAATMKRFELGSPPRSRLSTRLGSVDTRKKSVHHPEPTIEESPQEINTLEALIDAPRALSALLTVSPIRLQHLDAEELHVLAKRMTTHAAQTAGKDAGVALTQTQRTSVVRPPRSSIKLVKGLLGDGAAERFLRAADIEQQQQQQQNASSAARDTQQEQHKGLHRNGAAKDGKPSQAIDIHRLLRVAQRDVSRRRQSQAVVAVAIPREVPDNLDPACNITPRQLVSGAVAVTTKHAGSSPDKPEARSVHVGLLPMHEYVTNVIATASTEEEMLNGGVHAPTLQVVSVRNLFAGANATNNNNSAAAAVAAADKLLQPVVEEVDPISSTTVRERALEIASMDAGRIHSAAREELAARIADLRLQLNTVRQRTANATNTT